MYRSSAFVLLIVFWLVSLFASCFQGAHPIPASEVFRVIGHLFDPACSCDPLAEHIIVNLRVPRALLAAFCGAGLALSGVCLQGVLKNALADPFILGISQGAACGASLLLVGRLSLPSLALPFNHLVAVAAFLGAVSATGGTLLLGGQRGRCDPSNILLAGIAVATFLGALVALVKALHEESIASIVFWIMGSFQGKSWESVPLLFLCVSLGIAGICCFWRALDLFFLGDEQARHMGLSVTGVRLYILVVASLMTAGCVAVAGVIGFVGLVVPHILRLLFGARHGTLLCGAFFGGGILLLWADILARSALADGQEIPVGIVTSLLGAPFFAFLIRGRGGRMAG